MSNWYEAYRMAKEREGEILREMARDGRARRILKTSRQKTIPGRRNGDAKLTSSSTVRYRLGSLLVRIGRRIQGTVVEGNLGATLN